jgi:hypothetical protein
MGQEAKQAVESRDFPGLVTNADQHDLVAGAGGNQVNISSVVPGELLVRLGYVRVQFEVQ